MSVFSFVFKMPLSPQRRKAENLEQDIIDQANSFFQAGSRCVADLSVSPNVTNCLIAPAVVCYTFAIELYLKLLLRINNIEVKKTHHVLDMYKILPEDIHNKIAEQYRAILGRSPEQLIKDIEWISDAFVQWRYSYEHQSLNISPDVLREIGRILHNIIRKFHPSLGVTFENRLAIPEQDQKD